MLRERMFFIHKYYIYILLFIIIINTLVPLPRYWYGT